MSDNREVTRAGTLQAPAQHAPTCRCLKRRTEQSGEVHSDPIAHVEPSALAPATPLTGFIPRPNYTPPKVIVSQLLAGASVEVMVFENPPFEVLSRRDLPAGGATIDLHAMEDFGFGD